MHSSWLQILCQATLPPRLLLSFFQPTQAKTSIPGLGKPITAVDVTYDGRWILATTDDYLMVVKASFDDDGEQLGSVSTREVQRVATCKQYLTLTHKYHVLGA